ncbi:hypothetical protein I5N09_09930 [Serratia marcescens]|uniref:hypothetical protein n=1 Tax=Serratia marcescens TaxID=615 RepID=UPI000CDE53F7|nr:hypothetical protein [Serratia marcescens]MBH3099269.1 hypothetical protein [Serratia marcescens]MBH3218334.1 hypothetical protein [Serratia marcescens]POW84403.1 hypothetical protein C3461_24030 [Serratia marcescens]POW89138.1 hypothetical protein C3459_24015 [Serratia marcescens]POX03282.1 hypothetical protein C3458_24040 [Serratia marcescens]
MKKVILSAAGVIIGVCLIYYLNFGINGNLSNKTDVWGQFGDYLGGVVNPILSFITIYLLLNSIKLQREANSTLVDEVKRQESLEEYKKFEVRFFHLVECQNTNFSRFSLKIGDIEKQSGNGTEEFFNGAAVTYIEDSVVVLVEAQVKKEEIKNWLEEIDADDCIFSVVRRFYLIVKLIKECGAGQDDYYEILVNLTDLKILTLIAIACTYFDWDIIKYLKDSKVLERDGIKEFVVKISPKK